MDPKQAIAFLTNVTAAIPATRQQHQQIAQALDSLTLAIAPKQPVVPVPPVKEAPKK